MQNKNKFTPGPWQQRISQPGTMLEIVGENREYVCSLLGGDEHKKENANLIAAAPDMLSLLSDMLGDPTSGEKTNIGEYWKEEIKKAIAKARGE
jgi:hypothetical protein